jgi:hypothetical protein
VALKNTKAAEDVIRKVRVLESRYLGLRAKAGKLRRDELNLWRSLEKVVRRRSGRLVILEHKPGRKDKITHERSAGSGSLVTMARARGSSGLFCGCRVIRIQPQPNGDIDICILIDCSNDPETSGFRCHYWCATIEAEPVVAIARATRRRRQSR